MSEQSFSSFESALLVRDAQGHYLPATTDQILEAARRAVNQKMVRGTAFTSPTVVKEYLTAKLAGFDVEVFAVLFLDSQYCLIEYVEMFQGTLSQTSVYPREVAKAALHHHAAAVILAHNHPSGNPEPKMFAHWIMSSWPVRRRHHLPRWVCCKSWGFGLFLLRFDFLVYAVVCGWLRPKSDSAHSTSKQALIHDPAARGPEHAC